MLEPANGAAPTVSLLICTSGRPKLLDRCLNAVESGSYRPDQLVVVNGIDGRTPEVVAQHAPSFSEVVLVEHPNRSLAALHNLGLPFCSGDIIAMTDDDSIPDGRWITEIRAAHARLAAAGGIGGPVRGVSKGFLSRVADTVVFPLPRPGKPIATLPTVNMSYKRAAVEAVGEFDEALFRGEDVDYNWRVLQAGYEIAFNPAMKMLHEHRETFRGLYQQQYMYGRAYVLVREKWPAMYSVYPHSLRTARSWAKLIHAGLAIVYQPFQVASQMPSRWDRIRAYPVLVIHHFIWKLGMLRQAALLKTAGTPSPPPTLEPTVTQWP